MIRDDERNEDCAPKPTVLIVDDDRVCRDSLAMILEELQEPDGLAVIEAATVAEALGHLSTVNIDVVLLDVALGDDLEDPSQNGIRAIPRILELQSHVQILIVSGNQETQNIVRAMELGALGYVIKGQENQDLLIAQIKKSLRLAKQYLKLVRAEVRLNRENHPLEIPGRSAAAHRFRTTLHAVAQTDAAILLQGKSGAGKTFTAKTISDLCARLRGQSNPPFIEVSAAAFPETLMEREFFGSEKGAFTGAESRAGLIELADGGTLFIDEIGELSPNMQAKFLKVLEEKKYRRLGSQVERESHFRLVCATNRDLPTEVQAGRFRDDLWYRISTFVIPIPTVAERKEDLPQILLSIWPKACEQAGIRVEFEELPPDFVEFLSENLPDGEIRGLLRILCQLLVYCPKDERGRPSLKKWRRISGMLSASRIGSGPVSKHSISTDDLLRLPLHLGQRFTGLDQLIEAVTSKAVEAASERADTARELAALLKISPSLAWRLRKKAEDTRVAAAPGLTRTASVPNREEVAL